MGDQNGIYISFNHRSLAGTIGSLVGLGGGVIIVPALLF